MWQYQLTGDEFVRVVMVIQPQIAVFDDVKRPAIRNDTPVKDLAAPIGRAGIKVCAAQRHRKMRRRPLRIAQIAVVVCIPVVYIRRAKKMHCPVHTYADVSVAHFVDDGLRHKGNLPGITV